MAPNSSTIHLSSLPSCDSSLSNNIIMHFPPPAPSVPAPRCQHSICSGSLDDGPGERGGLALMEIVPAKVTCGDIYLHGTEFSVRLRTPEPIFEPMQRVISKVLIAFDINCGGQETFFEALELLSRDIANEMASMAAATSNEFLASCLWLWLHSLLRAELEWKGTLSQMANQGVLGGMRQDQLQEVEDDLRALRALICFCMDSLAALQHATLPPSYKSVIRHAEQTREPPPYCLCSAHQPRTRLSPTSRISISENLQRADEVAFISVREQLTAIDSEAAWKAAVEREKELENNPIIPSEDLSPGEALIFFKSKFGSSSRSVLTSKHEEAFLSESTESIASAQGIRCTRVQMLDWHKNTIQSPFSPSFLPINQPAESSTLSTSGVQAYRDWLLTTPPEEFQVGHEVERMNWAIASCSLAAV